MWSACTSGYSRSCSAVTTSCHSTPDFITLCFSDDVTLLPRFPRQIEGDARDAVDLAGVVDLGVDARASGHCRVGDLLRLAEIDAAGQLAHDDDVEPLDHLRLQRRGAKASGEADGRANVRRRRQLLALYANVARRLLSALASASSLKPEVVEGLDIVMVRELTGEYFGEPKQIIDLGHRQTQHGRPRSTTRSRSSASRASLSIWRASATTRMTRRRSTM